jgi:hypothetical protein
MQPRTISSSLTFVTKLVFPTIWISGFGCGTLSLWLRDPSHVGYVALQFAVAWIIGAALLWWCCVGLKKVLVDEEVLYISNYYREISVPLRNIRTVTQSLWISPHPVIITFHTATELGKRIKFMPEHKFAFWRDDSIVDELRQLAGIVDQTDE